MQGRNKLLIAVAVVITAAVVVAGATTMFSTKTNGTTTLRIGVLPVIDTLPLYVGVEQGLFSDQGVNVELVEFNSAIERDAAFTAGSIDGYFGDLVNTLVIAKSTGVKVITVDYHTLSDHRMFAILASPHSGINDLSQLNGTAIATSRASISEYFLGEMLKANNVTSEPRINEVPAISIRYQSLMSGQLSVAVLPEPFATRAIENGAILLADDRGIDTTATVIALRDSTVSQHGAAVRSFLAGYNASVTLVNQDPMAFNTTLESRIHFPPELETSFDFPPMSAIALPTAADLQRVQDWMVSKGMLTAVADYGKVMATELYG
ncbi:MAG: ABC transporter substrate-binding protein [Methanomassiliicoccus sp.]|nr:ABC transporter substrate-binding protein [Methanomassiliicoccus sp.]